MARLRENQDAMNRGEWSDLPDQQRQDLENTFRHTGQIARYTNIMGIKTVSETCSCGMNEEWKNYF